jgi:hypothetical protein
MLCVRADMSFSTSVKSRPAAERGDDETGIEENLDLHGVGRRRGWDGPNRARSE